MTPIWQCWYWKLGLATSLAIALRIIADSGNCALAQITSDGTLGAESSVVTPTNINGLPTNQIDGGATREANLFHSFEQFSVPTGGAAYFNNAPDIQNIISRVTGSSISNIDGLIRANGTANLFLLNPNGIIFGPNASLSIGGSFLGSTASSLNFADSTQFSAIAPQTTPLLTVSVPIGLQYGGTVGSILNQSRATNSSGEVVGLQVRPDKTLALVGGDVRLDGGTLQAPGGIVELGGVAGAGTVGLNVDGNNLLLSFPSDVVRADVALTAFGSNTAMVNVAASNGGGIAITARNIDILDGSKLNGGIAADLGFPSAQAGDIELSATGAINVANSFIRNNVESEAVGNGGGINITTGSLSVRDGANLQSLTRGDGNAGSVTINARDTISFDWGDAFSRVEVGAVGNSGSINITAGSLFVTNGAQLEASTLSRGNAGSVTINARDTVSFDGVSSDGQYSSAALSRVLRRAVGNGGNINITTGSLSVTNGAQLSAGTFGHGDAGSVTMNARDTVSFNAGDVFSTVEEGAVGNGGNINITAGSLSMTNGAQLNASTNGRGNAGSVNINARDTVSFDGVYIDRVSKYSSGALSTVDEGAEGNGGSINITTGSLSVTNGVQLNASTEGRGDAGSVTITARDTVSFNEVSSDGSGSGAFSSVDEGAVGNSGDINITTGLFALMNGAQVIASTKGRGDAGSVNINAHDTVSLDGESGAFSTVHSPAVGNGGGINITAGSLSMTNGAQLNASTNGRGNAGSVNINARDTVSFDGESGVLNTVRPKAEGNGGNINITTGSLSMTNGAQLSASTFGLGDAGNVNINARDTVSFDLGDAFSTVRPKAEGNGGNINITTGSLVLRNGAQLAASTLGQGDAGSVFVQADELVSLAGNQTTIFSSVGSKAVGNGGGIKITTGLSLSD